MRLLTWHCFVLTLITVFFICLVPYIPICLYYSLILCFYFHLLFPSLFASRHILQFTILIWFLYSLLVILPSNYGVPTRNITNDNLPVILQPTRNIRVNYNQPNALIISWNKAWVFSSSLSNYFLFSFWSGPCSHIAC